MTLREQSKQNWGATSHSFEEINCGSLQRIADACEAMSRNWQQLTEERDMYKRWYTQSQDREKCLEKTIAGLRGHITKLKKSGRHIGGAE